MTNSSLRRIKVIDSHTGGEPTRVVISGGPDLGSGPLTDRVEIFKRDFDHIRSAVASEPRASDAVVGALLCEPHDKSCVAGVIYFNNVAYIGMCGHGTIGLVVTLAHLGRISTGKHRIETPVGVVEAQLDADGSVTVANVPSYRLAKNVEVNVPGHGPVRGDVAWGGNWFFLIGDHVQRVAYDNLDALTDFTWRVRQALSLEGITGAGGKEIDHIELFADSALEGVNSKNFVLCPGKAYDRSPCGTGTSAKLVCLYDDGKIKDGEVWRQESIVGSIFEGRVTRDGDRLMPLIKGTAYITAEADLILDDRDPFCFGIRQ